MDKNNYIQKLPECINEDEVLELMKDRIFPGSNESKFSDEDILFPDANKGWHRLAAPKNNTLGLAMRTLAFLKLDGQIGEIPLRSGKYAYASKLFGIFKDLNTDDLLRNPRMIDSNQLDNLIKTGLEKKLQARAIKNKVRKLEDWFIAKDLLPFFLQIDPFTFIDSREYKKLLELHQKESSRHKKIGGPKEPYHLPTLKFIVGEAIKYIETYGEEILTCTKLFMQDIDKTTIVRKRILVKHLRSGNYQFSEPFLKNKQDYCKSLKSNTYISDKVSGTTPIQEFSNAISRLEAACIIVILMTTAMRKQELVLLPRYPLITKDQHLNLERMVYKTSSDEEGSSVVMPIPKITKLAIDLLSQLSELKDEEKTGSLNLVDINYVASTATTSENRINYLVNSFCMEIGVDIPPTPHQFRHAMAFIIVYFNEKDGLELASMFLDHQSIEMTLQYLGHANILVENMINELKKDEEDILLNIIFDEIKAGKNFFGPAAKRMFKNVYIGRYAQNMEELFIRSLKKLAEENRISILQAPTNICIHDLSNPNKMACQRGLNIDNIIATPIIPSRCEGAQCECALFTEQNVEDLKEQAQMLIDDYPAEFRDRLKQNTYFTNENALYEFSNPFKKLIQEYDQYKQEGVISWQDQQMKSQN